MADWFKLHENWFTEPRLQWAIKEQATVVQAWLWCLTECCRTKSDTIGLHSEDYEMIGIQQLLNLSPGLFNQGLNLLQKIRYIEIDKSLKTIKVLKWNDFQSDYLRKKDHRESDSVRQSPTKSDSVVLEERRVEEKRVDKKEEYIVVLEYLNLKSGKRFEPVEGNLKHIRARIKEGFDVSKLKAIVDLKCAAWLKKSDMAQYLRPATLFNAEKCAQYAGEIGAVKPKQENDWESKEFK